MPDIEELYTLFHTTCSSATAKWDALVAEKKSLLTESRSVHKKQINDLQNQILLLKKSTAALLEQDAAARAAAEKQDKEWQTLQSRAEQCRKDLFELQTRKALSAQNLALTLERVRSKKQGLRVSNRSHFGRKAAARC